MIFSHRMLAWLYAAVCLIGLSFRLASAFHNVTYIDEVIPISQGAINSAHGKPLKQPLLEFLRSIASHGESSYAPLQFALTYPLLPQETLSYSGLIAARGSALLMSLVAFIALPLACRAATGRALGWTFMLPALLLAFADLSYLNSTLAYPYISTVSIGLLALWIFISLRGQPRTSVTVVGTAFLAISPWFHYQLLITVAAGIAALSLDHIRHTLTQTTSRPIRNLTVRLLWLVPLVCCWGWTAWWVTKYKSEFGIPWWVKEFTITKAGFWEQASSILTNFYIMTTTLLTVKLEWTGVLLLWMLVALGFGSIVLGLGSLLSRATQSGPQPPSRSHLGFIAFSALTCAALYTFSALQHKVALSPSRHSLFLFPYLLVLLYCFLALIEQHYMPTHRRLWHKGLRSAYGTTCVMLLAIFVYYERIEWPERGETMQPAALTRAMRKSGTSTIVTSWFDYNKLLMVAQLRQRLQSANIFGVMFPHQFPPAPFLLVGQNPYTFYDMYPPHLPSKYKATLLHKDEHSFDYEPTSRINYWRNSFFIWWVELAAE